MVAYSGPLPSQMLMEIGKSASSDRVKDSSIGASLVLHYTSLPKWQETGMKNKMYREMTISHVQKIAAASSENKEDESEETSSQP